MFFNLVETKDVLVQRIRGWFEVNNAIVDISDGKTLQLLQPYVQKH